MTCDEPSESDRAEKIPHTILVVEDDESVGEFLSDALEQHSPYHCLYVNNAAEALVAVQAVKPNVFLLDYRLPGTDGLELADRLHALPGLETIPTVLMSANRPSREALRQRDITFLAKPFELATLLKVVGHLLAREVAEGLPPHHL